MAGKTGADAVYKAVAKICGTIKRYRTKLDAFIEVCRLAGVITDAEALVAHAFVSDANAVCSIFERIAQHNSLTP